MASYEKGRHLCKDGDKSREIYVLMSGELSIKSEDVELAHLKGVDIVGEMGVITGEPRCADIEAVSDTTTIMVIPKIALDKLMKTDLELGLIIHRNMLTSLCQKLRGSNVRSRQSENITSSVM
jgi:CRP-like cAMP-binding protein